MEDFGSRAGRRRRRRAQEAQAGQVRRDRAKSDTETGSGQADSPSVRVGRLPATAGEVPAPCQPRAGSGAPCGRTRACGPGNKPFVEDTRPAAVARVGEGDGTGRAPLSKAEITSAGPEGKQRRGEATRGEGNRLRYAAAHQSNFYDQRAEHTVRTSGRTQPSPSDVRAVRTGSLIHNFGAGNRPSTEAKKLRVQEGDPL